MGHVGSKTRLLGQILQKPCVNFRDHIFNQMKLGQNICLKEISDQFENGSYVVKNWFKSSKYLVYNLEVTFCLIVIELGQDVFLNGISYEFENGSCQFKT